MVNTAAGALFSKPEDQHRGSKVALENDKFGLGRLSRTRSALPVLRTYLSGIMEKPAAGSSSRLPRCDHLQRTSPRSFLRRWPRQHRDRHGVGHRHWIREWLPRLGLLRHSRTLDIKESGAGEFGALGPVDLLLGTSSMDIRNAAKPCRARVHIPAGPGPSLATGTRDCGQSYIRGARPGAEFPMTWMSGNGILWR